MVEGKNRSSVLTSSLSKRISHYKADLSWAGRGERRVWGVGRGHFKKKGNFPFLCLLVLSFGAFLSFPFLISVLSLHV